MAGTETGGAESAEAWWNGDRPSAHGAALGALLRRGRLTPASGLGRPEFKCPKCASRAVVERRAKLPLSHVETAYGTCADCGCVWEAYPTDWCEEVVGAEPCDNCAFAAGSPESADREGWLDLLSRLKVGQEFRCHKGCPINRTGGAAEFDEAWIKKHGRMCAGFLRATNKWPNWLTNGYATEQAAHVMTSRDAEKMGF